MPLATLPLEAEQGQFDLRPEEVDRVEPERPCLTKIVATLGPASDDAETLTKLIENGANVFRLNFSHGDFDSHGARLELVRETARRLGAPIAVLGDLQGPKIRVGEVPEGGVRVEPGQDLIFRRDIELAEAVEGGVILPCTYDKLIDEVEPGHRVLINDGAIRALATDLDIEGLHCRVMVGGLITTGKGVNLPDSTISAPAITERDWECVRWAVDHELDYLALSFVRRGDEVRELKAELNRLCADASWAREQILAPYQAPIPVIAKIEKPLALRVIDEILDAADAVMVARGDLGVEMELPEVPAIQKRLIAKAHDHGKPCIVATQMLESMISSPTPTRDEASDVANAIYDGADAVMLSGETAVGKYGPLAIDVMRRIAIATEGALRETKSESKPPQRLRERQHRVAALAHGAWHVVNDIGATLVAIWSESGSSARYLSRIGLQTPIVAFSSNARAIRRMALLYGVIPVHCATLPLHRSEFGRIIDRVVIERGLAQVGDQVVGLAGKPFGAPGVVNTVAIREIEAPTPK